MAFARAGDGRPRALASIRKLDTEPEVASRNSSYADGAATWENSAVGSVHNPPSKTLGKGPKIKWDEDVAEHVAEQTKHVVPTPKKRRFLNGASMKNRTFPRHLPTEPPDGMNLPLLQAAWADDNGE
jgi:hypothetical protein